MGVYCELNVYVGDDGVCGVVASTLFGAPEDIDAVSSLVAASALVEDDESTLPLVVGGATFGDLEELKYPPPPGLEKAEYALRAPAAGRSRCARMDIVDDEDTSVVVVCSVVGAAVPPGKQVHHVAFTSVARGKTRGNRRTYIQPGIHDGNRAEGTTGVNAGHTMKKHSRAATHMVQISRFYSSIRRVYRCREYTTRRDHKKGVHSLGGEAAGSSYIYDLSFAVFQDHKFAVDPLTSVLTHDVRGVDRIELDLPVLNERPP